MKMNDGVKLTMNKSQRQDQNQKIRPAGKGRLAGKGKEKDQVLIFYETG